MWTTNLLDNVTDLLILNFALSGTVHLFKILFHTKVPEELHRANIPILTPARAEDVHEEGLDESRHKMLCRRPSKKMVFNGLLLVGGAVCLTRANSALGAKVALAYILTKLNKRGDSQRKSRGSWVKWIGNFNQVAAHVFLFYHMNLTMRMEVKVDIALWCEEMNHTCHMFFTVTVSTWEACS